MKPVVAVHTAARPVAHGAAVVRIDARGAAGRAAARRDAVFATHDVGSVDGQPWKFVAQVTLHVVPLQTAVELVGEAHAVQPLAEQPEATLLLATHVVFAPCPHA